MGRCCRLFPLWLLYGFCFHPHCGYSGNGSVDGLVPVSGVHVGSGHFSSSSCSGTSVSQGLFVTLQGAVFCLQLVSFPC